MQLEQRHFNIVSIVRRWLWLLVLTTLVAALAAFWISEQQPAIHEASARLIIGPGIDSPSPELNSLRTGGQLMQTYAQIATTRPVLQAVVSELGLDIQPFELAEKISVISNEETQILTITVQDVDPNLAVAVANQIAEALVRMSPSGADSPAVQLNIQMRTAAEKLEDDIAGLETSVAALETRYAAATDIDERRLLLDELTRERSRLTDTTNTLARLYDSLSQASTNQVKIVEMATFSFELDAQTRLKVLIGAMVGLILSAVVVLAFEYFDETIKSAEELAQVTSIPVLGAIARHRGLRGSGRNRLAVLALPESRAAETYRMLGTKMLFSHGDGERAHSVMLSSGGAQVSEDTGETAANLAVILAQTGNRVILVDANLQRPTIAQMFGIEDRLGGLTDVLTGQAKSPRLTSVNWAPGLTILPSGPVSYDSFALLSSNRMVNLLSDLEEQADIVIITAAPLLSFADSLILASRVDGVAIVARRGKTRPDMISEVIKSLRSLDARILGTILDENRSLRLPFLPWGQTKPVTTLEEEEASDEETQAAGSAVGPAQVS